MPVSVRSMQTEFRRAAFIDRDGVINEELNYVYQPEKFRILPGSVDGLLKLQQAGYALVVITNQAGIARGLYTEADFQRLSQYMRDIFAEAGVNFTGIYFCPHHPDGLIAGLNVACNCRKPEPGMLKKAARDHLLNLSESILIGDKISDAQAGYAAGVRHVVLVRSGHDLPPNAVKLASSICDNLAEAAEWICYQDQQ